MDQLQDKEAAPRRNTDLFSSGAELCSQTASESEREQAPLMSQSIFGNAAVSVSPTPAPEPSVSSLQSSFGNAAVTRSAEVGELRPQPEPQVVAQPAIVVTTTVTQVGEEVGHATEAAPPVTEPTALPAGAPAEPA